MAEIKVRIFFPGDVIILLFVFYFQISTSVQTAPARTELPVSTLAEATGVTVHLVTQEAIVKQVIT